MPLSPHAIFRLKSSRGAENRLVSGRNLTVVVSPEKQRSASVTPLCGEEVGLGLEVPGRIPSGQKQWNGLYPVYAKSTRKRLLPQPSHLTLTTHWFWEKGKRTALEPARKYQVEASTF